MVSLEKIRWINEYLKAVYERQTSENDHTFNDLNFMLLPDFSENTILHKASKKSQFCAKIVPFLWCEISASCYKLSNQNLLDQNSDWSRYLDRVGICFFTSRGRLGAI